MPTIKDVAVKAQVSIATVSAVLNGTRPVSEPTRLRVEEAIRQLGYQPNRMARGLKQRKSQMIAHVLPSVMNPFFPAMLKGIEDIAYEADYSVLICNTEMDEKRIRRYSQLLLEMQTDGVVITAPGSDAIHELARSLREHGVPIVALHGPRSMDYVDRVLVNDEECGYLASSTLAKHGHQEIGFLGVDGSTTSRLRYQGFIRGLQSHGIELYRDYVLLGQGFSQEEGYRLGQMLFSNPSSWPNGIVAANDVMAIGLWEAALNAGLEVPEDVSLVGIDNTLASIMRPQMASVEIPTYEMGRLAGEQLLARITKNQEGTPVTIRLDPRLITGHTVQSRG